MSSSLDKHLKVFSDSISRAERGTIVARKSRNAELLQLNLRQGFKARIMLGLISWRGGLSSTPELIRQSTQFAVAAAEELSSAATATPDAFPYPFAAIAASLVDPVAFKYLSAFLPAPTNWASASSSDRDIDRETSLALAITAPEHAGHLLQQIRLLPSTEKEQLCQASHENYLSLIISSGSLENGAALYKQRKNDSYYSGSQPYYGGGPDNELVIDLFLAAAAKLAGINGEQVHAWRWQ